MTNKKYYAIWGYNAVGVCNSWGKVESERKYIRGFNSKSFYTFEEAENYALQMAEMTMSSRYFLPQNLKHNYVFFTTQLSKAE